jgi:DNA replication and repair protein RecF
MPLVSLELHNVRVYGHIRIEPSPHLNLIVGQNASGKTTLLEAVHLLGTGRSFRTHDIRQLQKHTASEMSVLGNLLGSRDEMTHLGIIHRTTEGRKLTVNGQTQTRVSGFAQYLPLQVISPETHYEFLRNANYRRGAIDWGLFHVEQAFQGLWSRYRRILMQRNAALKLRTQTNAKFAWDEEFSQIGEQLHARRVDLLENLLPFFKSCCQELLGLDFHVDLILEPGWNQKLGLHGSLIQDRNRDSARGFTHSGPHRADLKISLDKKDISEGASNSQIKLLVIALRMAQIRFLIESKNRHCCLLIDDLSAELDATHRASITKMLSNVPVQAFMTSTDLSLAKLIESNHKTFHVEQEKVMETILI